MKSNAVKWILNRVGVAVILVAFLLPVVSKAEEAGRARMADGVAAATVIGGGEIVSESVSPIKTGTVFRVDLGTFMDIRGKNWASEDDDFESIMFGYKISANASVGYRFSRFFYMGMGLAVDYYMYDRFFGFPIYGEIMVNILPKKISPFVSVKFGYSLGGKLHGYFQSIGAGVRFARIGKGAAYCGLYWDQLYESEFSLDMNAVAPMGIKVGYEF